MTTGSRKASDHLAIPTDWLSDPPKALVAGTGPYSAALAFILGAARLSFDELRSGPPGSEDEGFPRLLEQLAHAILVVPEQMSVAEAVECHGLVWHWIAKLSSTGDEHELRFLLVLPPHASADYERGLAMGLGLPEIAREKAGHGIWKQSGSLADLINAVRTIHPSDMVALRCRRAADARHIALARLRNSVEAADADGVKVAAGEVAALFSGHEYQLDVFCRAPSHRHGNLLRSWLRETVTKGVTPDSLAAAKADLSAWLAAADNHNSEQ